MKKYMIGLLVTNKYGVLTRIASLFPEDEMGQVDNYSA